MSVLNPNEAARTWQAHRSEAPVALILAEAEGDAASLVGARVAGFPIMLKLAAPDAPLELDDIASSPAAVIQVAQDQPGSIERFKALVRHGVPLIAAVYEPPLKLVRELILAGAHDVVPLPLVEAELERSLAPIREKLDKENAQTAARNAKVVTILKSVGGVGATSLITQVAVQYARSVKAAGHESCLIDLDLQFGDAAFQLGMAPKLTLEELVKAGNRLDGDLLRSIASVHSSGLRVIGAPAEMMPLESMSSEQVLAIVECAAREFGTVFVDLPSNWTNWSLSLVARSDVVLLVVESSVSCVHRARRQLDLLREQDLGGLDIRVVLNRAEKKLMQSVRVSDIERALGREVSLTVANDHKLMRAAIDRGVTVEEAGGARSGLARDIAAVASNIASALQVEQ